MQPIPVLAWRNGRRNKLTPCWAKARAGVPAVSLRLILTMLCNESGRQHPPAIDCHHVREIASCYKVSAALRRGSATPKSRGNFCGSSLFP